MSFESIYSGILIFYLNTGDVASCASTLLILKLVEFLLFGLLTEEGRNDSGLLLTLELLFSYWTGLSLDLSMLSKYAGVIQFEGGCIKLELF